MLSIAFFEMLSIAFQQQCQPDGQILQGLLVWFLLYCVLRLITDTWNEIKIPSQ